MAPAGLNDEGARLFVNGRVRIPLSEIELRVSRSSGPGGQHANKTESRVEAVFDVIGSASLGPIQKRRVIDKLGEVVTAVSQDDRSQHRNREIALARLGEKLAAALKIERPRKPTAPSKTAKRERLESKRRRGDVKRTRRKPSADD